MAKQFQIIEVERLSGSEAKIYTIKKLGDTLSCLEQFIRDNIDAHPLEVGQILEKLETMGRITGCEYNLFTHNEGRAGDGVVCLKAGRMRLYCMYFRETLVVCGSGGWKSPAIRAYQEDPLLNQSAQTMKTFAKQFNRSIERNEVEIETDGTLTFYTDDYEQ